MNDKPAHSELVAAILPFGSISSWQIKLTAAVLKHEFGVKTIILPPAKIPLGCFNAERNKFQANELLNYLFFLLPANAQRIVGIIEGDLEHGNGKPCVGLAGLYQRTALYSVPRDPKKSRESAMGQIARDMFSYFIITHEFAHTLGLQHCDDLICVMNPKTSATTMCAHCRKWANRELKVRPLSAEERFSFAENLCWYNCWHMAIAVYRQAIYLAPREPLYRSCLALALHHAGQLNEAREELMESMALSDDRTCGYYNLGLAYLHAGEYFQLAGKYFDRAISAAKDAKNTQKLVGQAYRKITHDVERASRHYLEYLRLGGDDRDVIDWLVSRSKLNRQ
jgi:predicted Zn-dependent protease